MVSFMISIGDHHDSGLIPLELLNFTTNYRQHCTPSAKVYQNLRSKPVHGSARFTKLKFTSSLLDGDVSVSDE